MQRKLREQIAAMLEADHFLPLSTKAALLHRLDGATAFGLSDYSIAAQHFKYAIEQLTEDVKARRIAPGHAAFRESIGMHQIMTFLCSNSKSELTLGKQGHIGFCVSRNLQLFLHLAERLFNETDDDNGRWKSTELLKVVLRCRPLLGRDQFPALKRSLSDSDLFSARTKHRPTGGGRMTQDDIEGVVGKRVSLTIQRPPKAESYPLNLMD
jgi:hypothetical protein